MKNILKGLFLLAVVIVAARFVATVFGENISVAADEKTVLGSWTEQSLESLIRQAAAKDGAEAKIEFLSQSFLGTPYAAGTLGGGSGETEKLTVDLSGLDCFTYIDYVESMRRSESFGQFRKELARTRYRDGAVMWEKRRHFFSDWVSGDRPNARDVTREIGGAATESAEKELNRKADGSFWLAGLPSAKRKIEYIPSAKAGPRILGGVRTGDYVGIYSDKDGLDVSHTGIAVRKKDGVYIRHASSLRKEVVDEKLSSYVAGKPGLVVYRAR